MACDHGTFVRIWLKSMKALRKAVGVVWCQILSFKMIYWSTGQMDEHISLPRSTGTHKNLLK